MQSGPGPPLEQPGPPLGLFNFSGRIRADEYGSVRSLDGAPSAVPSVRSMAISTRESVRAQRERAEETTGPDWLTGPFSDNTPAASVLIVGSDGAGRWIHPEPPLDISLTAEERLQLTPEEAQELEGYRARLYNSTDGQVTASPLPLVAPSSRPNPNEYGSALVRLLEGAPLPLVAPSIEHESALLRCLEDAIRDSVSLTRPKNSKDTEHGSLQRFLLGGRNRARGPFSQRSTRLSCLQHAQEQVERNRPMSEGHLIN
jgi:hypothetical protein